MDGDALKIFGQTAGIGGLAVGVLFYLFRDLLKKIAAPRMSTGQWFKVVVIFMVLVWSMALSGIAAWVYTGSRPSSIDFSQLKPILTSPDDKSEFSNFPRTLTLVWQKMDGAVSYRVERDILVPQGEENSVKWVSFPTVNTTSNNLNIEFGGANWGRWRVVGISAAGLQSQASDWRTFHFLQ